MSELLILKGMDDSPLVAEDAFEKISTPEVSLWALS